MWWRKATANFRVTYKDYDVFEQLSAMPDNQGEMGPWLEVPERLETAKSRDISTGSKTKPSQSFR